MSEASGSGRLRTVVGIVGVASAICAGIGVAAHFFGPVSTAVTLVASFSPLFVVLAAISVTVLVATRYWYVAAAALIITVVGVAAQLPLYLGERASAPADDAETQAPAGEHPPR